MEVGEGLIRQKKLHVESDNGVGFEVQIEFHQPENVKDSFKEP